MTETLTDEQIIERLATEVMGWELCGATETSWLPYWKVNNEWVADKMTWNPLTDWNHTMQVVQALVERGEYITIMSSHSEWKGWMALFSSNKKTEVQDLNPQRAICLSALLAR